MDPKVSTISPGLGGVTWPPFETWALEHETERALVPIVVIQLLSCRWLFVIAFTAALQASLSFTISWSLLKLMSTESVRPSHYLILSQFFTSGGWSIEISASESVLPMSIHGWFPLRLTGLISLLSKGLSSLLQYHSSKASILWHSAFLMIQLSQPYWKNYSFGYTDIFRQSNVSRFLIC